MQRCRLSLCQRNEVLMFLKEQRVSVQVHNSGLFLINLWFRSHKLMDLCKVQQFRQWLKEGQMKFRLWLIKATTTRIITKEAWWIQVYRNIQTRTIRFPITWSSCKHKWTSTIRTSSPQRHPRSILARLFLELQTQRSRLKWKSTIKEFELQPSLLWTRQVVSITAPSTTLGVTKTRRNILRTLKADSLTITRTCLSTFLSCTNTTPSNLRVKSQQKHSNGTTRTTEQFQC